MQREVILIFGQTGSGKTTEAIKIVGNLPRVFVAEANFGEFPCEQFSEYPAVVDRLEKSKCFASNVPFRVSYSPRIAEHPLIFDTAIELRNCSLVLEEADRFDDPRNFPEYDEVITRGRHYGVSIVALGLHPYKIPKELRRQCTALVSFRQIDPSDIDWLREIIGEQADALPSLQAFHKVVWTPATGAKVTS